MLLLNVLGKLSKDTKHDKFGSIVAYLKSEKAELPVDMPCSRTKRRNCHAMGIARLFRPHGQIRWSWFLFSFNASLNRLSIGERAINGEDSGTIRGCLMHDTTYFRFAWSENSRSINRLPFSYKFTQNKTTNKISDSFGIAVSGMWRDPGF